MRVLMITPYLPYPFVSGGHVRVYNLIKNLSQEHEITLLCYIRSDGEKHNVQHLMPYCADVLTVPRRPTRSPFNLFMTMFSKYPGHVVVNGFSKEMQEKIVELTSLSSFDVIHIEHYHAAQPALAVRDSIACPLLLSEQGVEFLVYERHFREHKNPITRLMGSLDAKKMKAYEIETIKKFDTCIEVSESDLQYVSTLLPQVNFEVVPNGVDCSFYVYKKMASRPKSPSGVADALELEPKLLFTGTFRFFGNVDAVLYFCERILGGIRNEFPNVKLDVVGIDPPKVVVRLASENIFVKGYLSIEEYRDNLANCAVFVAPLRSGSGTKMKILEAMAMGKAVVTTSIGIEGIEAEPGKEVMIADDPEDFAEKVIELLSNPQLRDQIGARARKLVESKHDWKPIAKKLSEIYENVVENAVGYSKTGSLCG